MKMLLLLLSLFFESVSGYYIRENKRINEFSTDIHDFVNGSPHTLHGLNANPADTSCISMQNVTGTAAEGYSAVGIPQHDFIPDFPYPFNLLNMWSGLNANPAGTSGSMQNTAGGGYGAVRSSEQDLALDFLFGPPLGSHTLHDQDANPPDTSCSMQNVAGTAGEENDVLPQNTHPAPDVAAGPSYYKSYDLNQNPVYDTNNMPNNIDAAVGEQGFGSEDTYSAQYAEYRVSNSIFGHPPNHASHNVSSGLSVNVPDNTPINAARIVPEDVHSGPLSDVPSNVLKDIHSDVSRGVLDNVNVVSEVDTSWCCFPGFSGSGNECWDAQDDGFLGADDDDYLDACNDGFGDVSPLNFAFGDAVMESLLL